ncbi:type II secretion system GspH family protein [Patescibacteria group bacterium]|nr:type II secretion system GspH family protein [Patescibacteria group bacterium]MBU1034903.1 type II secretion system GspH family protein [Patescibacteria group bacterium]MBU1629950.1 type II secretion system GspH family protein [Patescibacteria group bacterium]MBU1908272.1 type II secretion system GspH family protein [Patescibacteria group bacterium]
MTDSNSKTTHYPLPTTHFDGFTLIELMISISILTLISTATVFSLRSTRQSEELATAARLLASDVRNIQARALAANNVKICDIAGGKRVCEAENPSTTDCVGVCAPEPASRYGITFDKDSGSYALFVDLNQSDWRLSSEDEIVLRRNLNPLGGDKVTITELMIDTGSLTEASMAVSRQNGIMRIEACGESGLPACSPVEPKILNITLQHQQSGKTAVVEINSQSGRVSVE